MLVLWFQASDVSGNLYIFSIPELYFISTIDVFPYDIDEICCSPQKKWVFVSKKHPHVIPKVGLFYQLQGEGQRQWEGPALREVQADHSPLLSPIIGKAISTVREE